MLSEKYALLRRSIVLWNNGIEVMKFVSTVKTQFYTLKSLFKFNENRGKSKIKEIRIMQHN
jgi:hypothetical protein